MSQAIHLRRLQALLALEDLSPSDRSSFDDLRRRLEANRRATLEDDEVAAVWRACTRRFAGELVSRELVERGESVPEPEVLRHRPLRPPGRRA